MKFTMRVPGRRCLVCASVIVSLFVTGEVQAQARITAKIDSTRTTLLRGNVHPLARPEYDQGEVQPDQPMGRMMLVLRRTSAQEAALRQMLLDQQNKDSPSFHKWLTPEEFGSRFGPAPEDVQTVMQWLSAQGFSDIQVNPGRTVIEFSGTAAGVEQAFHTPIHHYRIDGKVYSANAADPQIPSALAPVVGGVVSLHNFPRRRYSQVAGVFQRDLKTGLITKSGDVAQQSESAARGAVAKNRQSTVSPQYTFSYNGTTYYALGPYDFATVYNLLPLWNAAAPIDGTNQTIAIVGETDIDPKDFVTFRQDFGLPIGDTSGPTGTQYLNIIHNGPAPGITSKGEETEADLDTQWAGAVAKRATIDLVISASTETAAGVDLSAEYIVDNNLAPIMSISYGECELGLGTAGNAFYNALFQQAAAQGITVFTSSGDSGAAGCDPDNWPYARYGQQVSGLTSTPYNVSVGGTDFYMPGNASNYWNTTNSSTTEASVKGYIPELVWNISCADPVWSIKAAFSGLTPEQTCNNFAAYDNLENIVAGGGGGSSCTQSNGTDATTCSAPYPKPSWQSGTGVPADGVRDVPDVSLFASSSVAGDYFTGGSLFNSFYIVCQQDVLPFGPCRLNTQTMSFLGVGGTSASAPAFAGIMALVNQHTGSRQGNANYVFYRLASQQDTASCNSSNGSGSSCIFNDVTLGSNSVPCKPGSPDCIRTNSSDYYGVLGNYAATTGYDRATGLGSVNVANLVNEWDSAVFAPTSTTLSLNPLSSVHGAGVTATATVTSASGTPTGDVSINGSTVNGSVGEGPLSNGVMSKTFYDLPGGTYSVRAHYGGDGAYAASDSSGVNITVTPENSTGQIETKSYDPWTGDTASIVSAPYGTLFLFRIDEAGVSGHGTPTGSVNLTLDGKPLDAGTFALNGEGAAEDKTMNVLAGQHTITAAYGGDASFNPGTVSHAFTVTPMPMACQVPVSNTSFVRPGWGLHLYQVATTAPAPGSPFAPKPNGTTVAPTGTISFYAGSTLLAGPIAVTGQGGKILSVNGGISTFQSPAVSTTGIIQPGQLSDPVPPITATYSGDSNYSGCTSGPLNIGYQTGLLTSTMFAYYGSSFIFQTPGSTTVAVTVTPPPLPAYEPAYPVPTGTVQLMMDGIASGKPVTLAPSNGNGSATVPISTVGLSYASHSIGFVYSGDSQYSPAQSGIFSFTLSPPDFELIPSYLSRTVTNGATSAPIGVQVIDLYGFTGTVSFSCTGLPRGATCNFTPSTISGNGSTSLTIGTVKAHARPASLRASLPEQLGIPLASAAVLILILPRKRRWMTNISVILCVAFIAGTTSCGGSGSAGGGGGGSQLPGASHVTLSAATTTPTEGDNDTFTATVTGSGTAQPTGTMQFSIDNLSVGNPVALTGSSSAYTTSFAAPGAHSVAASYSGDSHYSSSNSGPYSVNVYYLSGTSPGTYNVQVIAQSGSLTHTASLALTVQ